MWAVACMVPVCLTGLEVGITSLAEGEVSLLKLNLTADSEVKGGLLPKLVHVVASFLCRDILELRSLSNFTIMKSFQSYINSS